MVKKTDQLGFRRPVRISVIVVAMVEIIVNEQPAQLHAEVFHGEREVGQVTEDVVAILDSARSHPARQFQLIRPSGPRRKIEINRRVKAVVMFLAGRKPAEPAPTSGTGRA